MKEKLYTFLRNGKSVVEQVSPVLLRTGPTSITLELSPRFIFFRIVHWLVSRIEDDPHLNFIALLKHYKSFGNVLHGNIYELHRDRNRSYFKNFFIDEKLYRQVREELEWVYEKNKKLRVTITKWGVLIFDNYKAHGFNILLITPHSGTWMPSTIEKNQLINANERYLEEDIKSDQLYADLVLEKNGVWIDSKLSRFACDYNRSIDRAIYSNFSEPWIGELWQEPLTKKQRSWLMEGYDQFYFTLSKLIETYHFSIIVDGHTMKNAEGRPDIGIGTHFVPYFYLPIVRHLRAKLLNFGYQNIAYDKPWSGGNIAHWLHQQFPNVFTITLELNKKYYMTADRTEIEKEKVVSAASHFNEVFRIIAEQKKKRKIILP